MQSKSVFMSGGRWVGERHSHLHHINTYTSGIVSSSLDVLTTSFNRPLFITHSASYLPG